MKNASMKIINAVGVWLLGLVTLLCVGWLGDLIATGDLFIYAGLSSYLSPFLIGIILITAYGFCTYWLYQLSQGWFRPVTMLKQSHHSPVSALIVNVSTNKCVYQTLGNGFEVQFNANAKIVLPQHSIADDDQEVTRQISEFHASKVLHEKQLWNWQPILKALNHVDLSQLQLLLLVVTDDVIIEKDERKQNGSLLHQDELIKWLRGYRELDNVCIKNTALKVTSQSIEDLYQGYCDILDGLEAKGINSKQAVLDVTGGTAAMSMAASMATLHKKSRFQFVNQSTNNIENYNLTIQQPSK